MTVSTGPGTLLGRDAEVAQALQVLTGESGGHVAVVGPAGIGKSALVGEVVERVSVDGLTVRGTTGAASESDLPFVGIHDLLGDDLDAVAGALPEPLQEALDVALLRSRRTEQGIDPVALNLGVLRVVEHLSSQRRLLLVLDDLPWVDTATRSSLAFVLRRLPPERVSTLVAMRPEAAEVGIVPPAAVETIAVGPLDPATLVAAVELRLGTRLPRRFAAQLPEASGGNPLLALELARTATLEHGAYTDVAVPERYRAILTPRLEGLSSDGRRALLAASLLSRPTLEELGDVVPVEGLLECETAGILRIVDGRVEFTHPLFASLCRDAAGGGERRDAHALLAMAARDPLERARHLAAATLLPDEDVAAEIEAAAGQARARAAVAAAAELTLLAERVTPSGDLARRTTRACTAAELFFDSGDPRTAADVVRPLLGELERGPLRARCLTVLARVTAEDTEGAAELFREALRQPGLDTDVEYELRFEVAGILGNLGDLVGSRKGVAALETQAVTSGRRDLARRCRSHLVWVDLVTGTPLARSGAWGRVVADEQGYELGYLHPDLLRAFDAMSRDDNARAVHLIDALMERARRVGNIYLWGLLAQHLGDAELRRGNVAAACRLTHRAYRVLADGRHDEGPLYYRAIAVAWQGRLDDARSDGESSLAMAQRVRNRHFEAPAHHVLGFIGLSSGDFAAAAEHYAAVAACMKAMRWRHPALLVWHGNAVEALLAVGRRAEAVALTDELARLADELDLATSTALALRCRALLAVDAGDLDAATAALDESLSLSEALDNPLEHARTLLVRGVVHRRRHQKALARTDLRHAADTFAHHGAAAWAARAEREHDRSTTLTGTELTASERAVAELAASGATNREIAAALFLSEKTVEAVLTRVYRKLSVHSRIQLGRHPAFAPGSEGRT